MYQLKGNTATVTSADNIGKASAVHIRALAAGNVTVTAASGTSNYAGMITLVQNEVIILAKQPTDTITCSAGMAVTPIAYHW